MSDQPFRCGRCGDMWLHLYLDEHVWVVECGQGHRVAPVLGREFWFRPEPPLDMSDTRKHSDTVSETNRHDAEHAIDEETM